MTHPIRVRELREADLSVVRVWMREEPSAPSWGDDDLAQIVVPASSARRLRRAWVAEDAGQQPVGFAVIAAVRIERAPAECELEFLYVIPPARRAGIARALLDTLLHWAHELGAQEIWLEVRASNAPAIALYTHHGFAAFGSRPGYYAGPPEDALLMRCTIAAPV